MLDVIGLGLDKVSASTVPPGRFVDLPGRGTTFACVVGGPPGAPAVLLLHGLSVTGYLNWFPAFAPLARSFRVVAMDLRGHGRGIPLEGRFTLEDCADDAAALAEALAIESFIVVGYSLGGPIAQLMWRRHRDRVAGLVLCATSRNFGGTRQERAFYSALLGGVMTMRLARRLRHPVDAEHEEPESEGELLAQWAVGEMRRTSPDTVLQAMNAMGRFTSHQWVEDIDVPTAVVVTARDRLVSPARQLKLARAIDGATLHPAHAGHAACVMGARRFVPALVEACESVAERLPPRGERPGAIANSLTDHQVPPGGGRWSD